MLVYILPYASQWLQWLFSSDKNAHFTDLTTDVVVKPSMDVASWSLATGWLLWLSSGVIASWDTGADSSTGAALATGIVYKEQDPIQVLDSGTALSYRVLIPYLDKTIGLPEVRGTVQFNAIAASDPLYPPFVRAWWKRMIGTNINPDRQLRCANFMVVYWLAKWWKVNPNLPVLDSYRAFAQSNDLLGSCTTKEQIATQDMLSLIQ